MIEYETSSHGNNYYDNKYGIICDRSNDDNPPRLPLESLDDDVWNLEGYQSNENNNNFNYDDIDIEILRFKYEDLIGVSETFVFHDCDDVLDATQQEEGKHSIIELATKDNSKCIYYDTVYLVLLISRMLSFVTLGESLVYYVNLF